VRGYRDDPFAEEVLVEQKRAEQVGKVVGFPEIPYLEMAA